MEKQGAIEPYKMFCDRFRRQAHMAVFDRIPGYPITQNDPPGIMTVDGAHLTGLTGEVNRPGLSSPIFFQGKWLFQAVFVSP